MCRFIKIINIIGVLNIELKKFIGFGVVLIF